MAARLPLAIAVMERIPDVFCVSPGEYDPPGRIAFDHLSGFKALIFIPQLVHAAVEPRLEMDRSGPLATEREPSLSGHHWLIQYVRRRCYRPRPVRRAGTISSPNNLACPSGSSLPGQKMKASTPNSAMRDSSSTQ